MHAKMVSLYDAEVVEICVVDGEVDGHEPGGASRPEAVSKLSDNLMGLVPDRMQVLRQRKQLLKAAFFFNAELYIFLT